MPLIPRAAAILRTLHWRRGLRAGFAVATAMLVCRALGRPMGWAALGGFEAVLVDNGGPYRSRMNTIATVLFGGALCAIIGTLVPQQLAVATLVTAAVCFLVTFARVASQPIASTAVVILVIYFAGYGSAQHTLHAALVNVLAYILGGLWAAVLSLFLWPVDPFRPARLAVAGCYDLLAEFTANLHASYGAHPEHDDDHTHAIDFRRQLRTRLESARAALGATPARAPPRTHRARNLSVLLESADMLFAATLRLTELAEIMPDGRGPATLDSITHWLSGAENAIAGALRTKPADNAASFAPDGSHYIQYITRQLPVLAAHAQLSNPQSSNTPSNPLGAPFMQSHRMSGMEPTTTETQPTTLDPLMPHLVADERDALQNIEVAFEAVRAIWTGTEARPSENPLTEPSTLNSGPSPFDALRHNWSLDSTMMRHALRMAAVGAADVLLMRAIHINHGFWLAMTSIIILQPYGAGTLRKVLQRVGGTLAGGILAALLAAVIHTYAGIIAVITVGSILALATYAIDYGWYSFFLTPTFILLSLPYLQDWRYAGLRIYTTMLGALVAIVAMRALWPESLTLELSGLLARSASAAAAYLRAVLLWWRATAAANVDKKAADREFLAPARRACGLTSQDAEEAVDRALLDPLPNSLHLGHGITPQIRTRAESALTFTTYIRRFTQCLTTLASVGAPTPETVARLTTLITRLDAISASLLTHTSPSPRTSNLEPGTTTHYDPASTLAEQMLQRMERQTGVLERTAATITTP